MQQSAKPAQAEAVIWHGQIVFRRKCRDADSEQRRQHERHEQHVGTKRGTKLGIALLRYLAQIGLRATFAGLVAGHILLVIPFALQLVMASATSMDERIP